MIYRVQWPSIRERALYTDSYEHLSIRECTRWVIRAMARFMSGGRWVVDGGRLRSRRRSAKYIHVPCRLLVIAHSA